MLARSGRRRKRAAGCSIGGPLMIPRATSPPDASAIVVLAPAIIG